MTTTHIRIFYPADPLGVVPGGIDTFLRGLIKYAPPDIAFSLVGMTTDPVARPEGVWTRCRSGQREFDFFPVVTVSDAGGRGRLPLSLRFTWALWRNRTALQTGFDVFDFHRVEPSLLFAADHRPKNAYFHNDPNTIRMAQSDNLWKRLPGLYEFIEAWAFSAFESIWCVRESGVQALRERYPAQSKLINFIPTWVDTEVFNTLDDTARGALRHDFARASGLDIDAQWLITVGRLDRQKDPQLMLAAFARLRAAGRRVEWLVVGDGVLRPELEQGIAQAGLSQHVHFLGLQPPAKIAQLLQAADVFALSSAYEGMPMALLEALACGLPAAVTDVGEVRRVVLPGINGAITAQPTVEVFAATMGMVLDNAAAWRGAPAREAIEEYQPATVLQAAYENYRKMAENAARVRRAAHAAQRVCDAERPRCSVVGVPIDVVDRTSATERLIAWAKRRESRTVCFVNVHSAVQATQEERHRQVLLGADLLAADGAPIALTLRQKLRRKQQRVDGPTMMWRLCVAAAAEGVSIGLYGSRTPTLKALADVLHAEFPNLNIAYSYSPPFRQLTAEEDAEVCAAIARSGVGLLFVGLGCPKQELWMARHRDRIPAVMLGVGAGFEFAAGTIKRAPVWMRRCGMEWLYRLVKQPRQLWRRYVVSNSLFLAMTAREVLLGERAPAPHSKTDL